MLKLQSKGGKFDIVLSDASLKEVGSVKKNNVRSLSSAGRRKTKEVKGHHILPDKKDESPRQLKGRESRINAKPKEEKNEKKITSKSTSRSSKGVEQMPPSGPSRNSHLASTKTKPIAETRVKAKGFENGKSSFALDRSTEGAGVITQSELMSIVESLKGGDVSLLQSVAAMKEKNKGTVIVRNDKEPFLDQTASSQLHKNIFEQVTDQENRQTEVSHRAEVVSNAVSKSSYMKSKDSVSTISLGESQGGAYASPEQNSSNIYASPRGKTERFAMRSSFAIGAPGQVAFDYNQANREKNKQWLADLEKQMQEKKAAPMSDKERLARAMENPAAPAPPKPVVTKPAMEASPVETEPKRTYEKSPITGEPSVLDTDRSFRTESDQALPDQKTFARGQNAAKSQFELDEIERQRKKILEHQRAVEQQVEEKRRLKMLERERRIKEERDEEERLAKERDQLAWQHEQESRKQMEREEAERQRHEALQRSVLEAYDAAKREKLNARLQKLKARGHDVSKLVHNMQNENLGLNEGEISEIEKELSRLSIPSVSVEANYLISSRSDKEFRPILNLTDDNYDQREKERKKESMNKESKKAKNPKNDAPNLKKSREMQGKEELKTKELPKKKDPKRSSFDLKKQKEKEQNKNVTVQKGSQKTSKISTETRSNLAKNSSKDNAWKNKTKNAIKSERLLIKHEQVTDEDLPQTKSLYDDEYDNLGIDSPAARKSNDNEFEDEGQFSYNRSSTVNLDEEPPPQGGYDTNHSRSSYQRNKEENSNWDTWAFPTERQQQILDQLQALRKGLLDKQREYERGTTPASGEFVNRY